MNLLSVETGAWVRVLGYEGARGLEHKLRQYGMLPGDYAQVLRHAPFGGPLLVQVCRRTIALGRGVAARIEVELTDQPCDSP